MAVKIKNSNGKWIVDQKAIQTSIVDLEGNFESTHVEGALRELSDRIKQGDGTNELKTKVNIMEGDIGILKNDVEWLKENGGGGGGTVLPTITSTFVDCAIEKGASITIPIYFTSPNMGDGTAYILINNILVFTLGVNQGNNNIKIEYKYLEGKSKNNISIYVKDRASLASNQLNWNIIVGAIDLSTTFDYDVDYGIANTINMPYTINTEIDGDIILNLTINGTTYEIPSVNGYNTYKLSDLINGLGVYTVSMYASVKEYKSNVITFNLVIVSTKELYLTSTFVNGSTHNYGVPINVNYRLSKLTSETYTVYLMVDKVIKKTQKRQVGNYYWTIGDLSIGSHVLTIRVTNEDETEDVFIDLDIIIEKGDYSPIQDYTMNLLCDLNAMGKDNKDNNGGIWEDESGNGHNGELIDFNFSSNGFINNQLICDAGAYVKIPWSPWSDNAINGSTIDIIYTPINSGIETARVIDYTEVIDEFSTDTVKPFKGVFADIEQTTVSSASSGTTVGKVNLDDESGEIHLTWVLDRENKFMKTYVNGVLSRIMFLTDEGSGVNKKYEDFSHNNYIYLNSTKGENCGTNNIKRFRVYGHALTSDQVLQNHLANIKDLEKQEEQYKFNYENTTLPVMKLWGDTTNMTDKQTVNMQVQYISPNEEKYGASFYTNIPNNPVRIQGTSSLAYVRKNYTVYLKDEYGADMYYNPFGEGSMPENVFCLKCDYVESSHANNTGMAKFINDCVYETKLPTQIDDNNHRSTINGFPIILYINDEYMGVYNLNHDRYSTQSLGYDYKKYPNILVYEINSNSNVSAGAFYKYGENSVSSSNITELEYYKRDFNLIYGNRTSDTDTYAEIKNLVEWVSVAEQDLFRETIHEHFNTEYLFRYFLTVLMIGAVDSLGKNMKLFTIDGRVFYPTFYDIDTCLGIDNSGYLTIEPDVEIESGSYNTSNSNLWNKVWNYFRQELKEEWSKMRQGNFTLDNLMKYIYDQQIAVIPPKYYNDDAQIKYLNFGSLYTYCCHGSKEQQIKRWLRERIAYVDSMLGYFTSQNDQITIRMNKSGNVSFEVTPYIPLYFSVKWSNSSNGVQTIKIKRGETKTFTYNSTTNTDQEVIIYHAQYIKRLDGLSDLNPSSCILSDAIKLTNIEIHSDKLYNINLTNNRFLRTLDLSGCSTLGTVTATGSSLDLTNCKYLQYVNVYKTALTSIELGQDGGSVKEIYYPSTIQSVSLVNQPMLEVLGLPYGSYGSEIPQSLYTVNIENCPNIKKFNGSSIDSINTTFISMKYVNNLILNNSLNNIDKVNYYDFDNLQSISLINMSMLKSLGFDNMCSINNVGTLKYIKVSGCNNITEVTFNTSDPNIYGCIFAEDCVLNISENKTITSISGNAYIKGLKTIILPISLKNINFQTTNGSHTSIVNLWSSTVCSINTSSTIPIVTHIDNTFNGMDFSDININNINMYSLINIPKAINFNIAPTTINPNFNTCRDGSNYPFLLIEGNIDLSNYIGEYDYLFKGLNFENITLTMPSNIAQTSFNYCFANSKNVSNIIDDFLDKINIISGLYMFYESDITDTLLQKVVDKTDQYDGDISYAFSNCNNINNPTIELKPIIKIEGLFKGSSISDLNNIIIKNSNITSLFEGCSNLTNDIEFPSVVVNCAKTFANCENIVNVTSNWETSSAITTTNCYYGCININYIDNKERIMGYYFIPTSWGGEGLIYETVTVLRMVIPSDNYTVPLKFYTGVSFGDYGYMYLLNKDTGYKKSYTFTSDGMTISTVLNSGEYYLLGNKPIGGTDYYVAESWSSTIKEILHLNEIYTYTDYEIQAYKYVEKMNLTNCKIEGDNFCSQLFTQLKEVNLTSVNYTDRSLQSAFSNSVSLTTIIGLDTTKCDNFEGTFSGCTSLKEDIVLTSNVITARQMFLNCTGLRSVHSNWITCPSTNGIDCYTGCSAIQLIDGEPGDIKNIPQSWGGSQLLETDYDIVTVSLPEDGITITIGSSYNFRQTDWGDGTVNSNNSHTYETSGTYIIKTGWNIFCNSSDYSSSDYTIKLYAIEINQVSNSKYESFYNMFAWYSYVTKIDLTTYKSNLITPFKYEAGFDLPKGCTNMFYQTRALKTIIGLDNIDFRDNQINSYGMFRVSGIENFTFTQNFLTLSDYVINLYTKSQIAYDLQYMFSGSNITNIDFSPLGNIPKLGFYLHYVCRDCKNLTEVNLNGIRPTYYYGVLYLTSAFEGCALTRVEIPNLNNGEYKDGITPSLYMENTFKYCDNLEVVNFNTNVSKINSLYGAFYGCTKLNTIINLESFDIDGASFNNTFYNCKALENITLKKLTNATSLTSICNGCTSLKSFKILEDSTGLKGTASSDYYTFSFSQAFYNCINLISVDLSKFNIANKIVSFDSTFYHTDLLDTVNIQFPVCNYVTGAQLSFSETFKYSGITSIPDIWNIFNIDTIYYVKTFWYCNNIERIEYDPYKIYEKATMIDALFNGTSLKYVSGYAYPSTPIDIMNTSTTSYNSSIWFPNSPLEEIGLIDFTNFYSKGSLPTSLPATLTTIHFVENSIGTENHTQDDITAMGTIVNLATNLNKESLLSLIDALIDITDYETPLTFALSDNHKAKLTDEEIAIATLKGWTI